VEEIEANASFRFLGCWLFEARLSSVIGGGMQFIIQVGEQTHLPPVPSDFPHCGDHKKPIFIF
jgi:hypothetical protein